MALSKTPGAGRAIVPVSSSRIRRADEHPVAIFLGSVGPASRRKYRAALIAIAAELSRGRLDLERFPWEQLRHHHTAAVRQLLIDSGRAPATVKIYLAALRGVLRSCWQLGIIDDGSYTRAIALAPVRGSRLPPGRSLDQAELDALFRSCKADLASRWEWDRFRGARDAAMLGLLYGGGLRRSEVARLQLDDLRGDAARVLGKGNKERLVPLPAGTWRALHAWLALRGRHAGPLLTRLDSDRGLSDQAIYEALRRRAAAAGIRALTPHDLRRSFDSDLLDAGVDLSAVQKLMGHAKPETTARYDRRGQRQLTAAVQKLRIPF